MHDSRNPLGLAPRPLAPAGAHQGLIIIPALNEAEALPEVVRAASTHLPTWDVLVVDDGSSDATATFAAPGVAVIHLPFNLGIGGAVQAGYQYAERFGYPLALQIDGDGQHPAEAAPLLVQHLLDHGADMVVGSRFLERGRYQQTTLRSIGIVVLRSALQLLTGRRFSDCTSGFRVVNRRLIVAFSRWYPDDYPEPEVLLHLHRANTRVLELSVDMRPRRSGKSSIKLIAGVVYVMKVLFAIVLGLFRRPWNGVFDVAIQPDAGDRRVQRTM